MSISIIFLVSFVVGVITLIFSFGLNIMLTPILALFLPINLAIVFTGVAFVFYNSIRLMFTWKYISWEVTLKFIPFALLGVVLGGSLLSIVLKIFSSKSIEIIMGAMLLILVLLEFFKLTEKLKLKQSTFLFGGGFVSGFVGGLVGSQGPFRVSALLPLKLDYQTFLATSTALGLIIDGSRIIFYFFTFLHFKDLLRPELFAIIAGSVLGFLLFFKFTKNIKMEKFKPIILVFIIILVCFMIFF